MITTGEVPAASGQADDLAAKLRSVAELHQAGALSDDEFATAKSLTLGSA